MPPRRDPEDEWVYRDLRLMVLFFFLLVLAGLFQPFVYAVLAFVAYVAVRSALYLWRRRQRERAHEDAPFWADRLEP